MATLKTFSVLRLLLFSYNYIQSLKKYLYDQLIEQIPGVSFNGDPFGKSLYTLLSVNFPKNERTDMLLFNLDIQNVCTSGGSACSSGAQQGSHVINAIKDTANIATIRFSFSKNNTTNEIDQVIQILTTLI